MSTLEQVLHLAIASSDGPIPGDDELAEMVRSADPLRSHGEVAQSVAEIRAHLFGLGPIDSLLRDPTVSDIMINGPGVVWTESAGRLAASDISLSSAEVDLLVERIIAPLGKRADPLHPLVDGRLGDGSRVHIVVPPLAVDGPCITIRRFSVRPVGLGSFAPRSVCDLLTDCVRSRLNIVVSGATGSGKTTLLNALGAAVPVTERIVTVEDAAELRLEAPHVVRLESRGASPDGAPEVSIRELVRNALRMRPDRLVVGEVRGTEAFDLLAAMSTGHDGSLSTVHANSAPDALHRLTNLVLMADIGLPAQVVLNQLAAAIDLVVHVERDSSGRRVVAEVCEVGPDCGGDGTDGLVRTVADRHGVVASLSRRARRNEIQQ